MKKYRLTQGPKEPGAGDAAGTTAREQELESQVQELKAELAFVKGSSVLREGSTVVAKYEFMESHKTTDVPLWTVVKMCAWLGVSRSGYYNWRARPQSATAARREALTDRIQFSVDDSDQTYGYRRVHADLVEEGTQASPELVRQIMAEKGMITCQPARSGSPPTRTPTLLPRDFTATARVRNLSEILPIFIRLRF